MGINRRIYQSTRLWAESNELILKIWMTRSYESRRCPLYIRTTSDMYIIHYEKALSCLRVWSAQMLALRGTRTKIHLYSHLSCVCVCACVFFCVYVSVRVSGCVGTCLCALLCVQIQPRACAYASCWQTNPGARAHERTQTQTQTYTNIRYGYIKRHIYTHITYVYIHTYVYAYIQTCLQRHI